MKQSKFNPLTQPLFLSHLITLSYISHKVTKKIKDQPILILLGLLFLARLNYLHAFAEPVVFLPLQPFVFVADSFAASTLLFASDFFDAFFLPNIVFPPLLKVFPLQNYFSKYYAKYASQKKKHARKIIACLLQSKTIKSTTLNTKQTICCFCLLRQEDCNIRQTRP